MGIDGNIDVGVRKLVTYLWLPDQNYNQCYSVDAVDDCDDVDD